MEYENVINEIEDSIKEDKRWCVYMHTNKINNKVYVGLTCRDVKERWENGNRYTEDQSVFHRAIKKYGWDGFEHIIFAENLTKEEAITMEIALIALYKTNCCRYQNPSYGYNMTDGGEGRSGYVMPEESRKKISEARKGIVFSEETIQKMREAQIGKKHTDETKKKMSQSHSGEKNYLYGKHLSDETKKKLSEAIKGMFVGEKNYFYGKRFCGINNYRAHPVYCIELNEIFWGVSQIVQILSINRVCVTDCCRGKQKTAGVHPETGERLHWLYAEDAIREGYITQQDLDSYLQEIRNKGDNDNED